VHENGRHQQRSLHHQAKHGEWVLGFQCFRFSSKRLFTQAGSSVRASVWREVFISQEDVSSTLAPSGAQSSQAPSRAT
jgi:hypothetical protein